MSPGGPQGAQGAPRLATLRFFVPGLPVPQGSKRVVRGRLIDANHATLRPYRALVADAALEALGVPPDAHDGSAGPTDPLGGHIPTREPVTVALRFGLPRPRGHYGTGRNAGIVKPSAPVWPATKPDVDKLVRAVLDALTGIVWVDDSQVAILSAEKVYSPTPHTVVTVQAPPVVAFSADLSGGPTGGAS